MSIFTKTRSRRDSCRQRARAVMEPLEERTLFSLIGIGAELGLPATSIGGPAPTLSSVNYSASTHALNLTGVPISMILSTSTVPVNSPSGFTISLTVDNSGNAASGASPTLDMTMTGNVTIGSTTYSGTLLTGTLNVSAPQGGFGYSAGTGGGAGVDNFDFQFQVTGGQLAAPYFAGSDIGVTLSDENSNFVDFNSNFSASPVKGYVGSVPAVGAAPISLSGFKYQDMTGNGLTADDTAHPLSGVTIQLLNSGNHVIATTVTAANGAYVFNNSDVSGGLSAGTYTVREVTPTGYIETAPASGAYTVIATEGSYSNLNFDNYKTSGCNCMCGCGSTPTLTTATSSLSGTVFADCKNDGHYNQGDAGISGVKITLTGTNLLGNNVTLTTTTDRNGNYNFSKLIAGNYTITESQPAGYTDGADSVGSLGGTLGNDSIGNITVPPCAEGCGYNFAEVKTTSICGNTGHGNCHVQITGCDDKGHKVCYTTTTDCHGNFSCDNIRGGCYTVTECDSRGHNTGYHNDCNIDWSSKSCSYSFGGFSCNSSNSFGCGSSVNWDSCFSGGDSHDGNCDSSHSFGCNATVSHDSCYSQNNCFDSGHDSSNSFCGNSSSGHSSCFGGW